MERQFCKGCKAQGVDNLKYPGRCMLCGCDDES